MSDYFKPRWQAAVMAPYGLEDARTMAKMPCPTGYLAKGFLTMNLDLMRACNRIIELEQLLKEKKDEYGCSSKAAL